MKEAKNDPLADAIRGFAVRTLERPDAAEASVRERVRRAVEDACGTAPRRGFRPAAFLLERPWPATVLAGVLANLLLRLLAPSVFRGLAAAAGF